MNVTSSEILRLPVCGKEDKIDDIFKCRDIIPTSNQWLDSFAQYLTARVILDVLRASSLMLFEGAVAVIIKEHGGDYGLQKLFGTFGAVIFSPLAGKLIDVRDDDDYTYVILLYCGLRVIVAFLTLRIALDFKPPSKKVFKSLGKVLCRPHVLNYLMAFSVAGVLWGFVESYLFWHLEDLGATKLLMGISLAVGTLAGLPVTIFSRLMIGSIGHEAIAFIALSLYGIRFIGYSALDYTGPELALAFEFFKPLCTTLLLISAMTFVKDVSPMTSVASMECVFGSMYFGVGRGLGGLIGAKAWDEIGAVDTFRLFGAGSMAMALIFAAFSIARKKFSKKSEGEDCEGNA